MLDDTSHVATDNRTDDAYATIVVSREFLEALSDLKAETGAPSWRAAVEAVLWLLRFAGTGDDSQMSPSVMRTLLACAVQNPPCSVPAIRGAG